jgi:ferredoxin
VNKLSRLIKVCYFSGTGNTLWSAKKIAESSGDEYELINIGVEAEKDEIILEAAAVALLFPSYAYGLPLIVRKFAQKAIFKTQYIAAFVTYGTSPGGTLAEIARVLRRKGESASYLGRIPAVENYIAIFGAPKPKITERRLKMQREATEKAARCLAERQTNSVITFRPFSILISLLFSIALKVFYKCYKVSADCDGCEICKKVCPVSAVTMKEGRPVFNEKCEHCQACLNWCPKKAIQFARLKPGSPRYHHPEIDISEISRVEACLNRNAHQIYKLPGVTASEAGE